MNAHEFDPHGSIEKEMLVPTSPCSPTPLELMPLGKRS